MKITSYKGFILHESDRWGKTVKGNKKTSSIQVRWDMGDAYLLKKTVSFKLSETGARNEAIEKAKRWVDNNPIETMSIYSK